MDDNYYVNLGVALNRAIKGTYPTRTEWLFDFRIDVQDDSLGATPEERLRSIQKLTPEAYLKLVDGVSQPDPYQIIDTAMPYFEKMMALEQVVNFIHTTTRPEFQAGQQAYLMNKITASQAADR